MIPRWHIQAKFRKTSDMPCLPSARVRFEWIVGGNVRGEPIVCTPADAFRCVMGTDVDTLIVAKVCHSREVGNPETFVKAPWAYILARQLKGTLYVGGTSPTVSLLSTRELE